MKKGCKPYKVNSKNSYTSTKNFLIAKGLIDKFLNITDYNNFKKEVVQLTNLAKDKHGIDEGPLFGERTISTADTSYYQAVANKKAFNKIDGIKKKAQPKQELTDYYMGDEALREQEERETTEEPIYVDQVTAVEQKIGSELPAEVAKAITVLNDVPLDILGRDDLFLSLKDILNDNGIRDEVLINWAGINKDILGHPKNIKSDKQLEGIIKKILDKKQKEDQYIEFKINPLALKSFREWIKALEKYSPAFQERMLTHAIKYITNPTRKSKYVLQLSEVALTKAHGIVVNKPHELNRIGKLYDQEVLATVSDAVDHEPAASGKGYWVHIPKTESNKKSRSLYTFNYKTYEDFSRGIKVLFKDLKISIEKQEQITSKKPVFTNQEPNLIREDAVKYGFKDYDFVRVESTDGRKYDAIYDNSYYDNTINREPGFSFHKKAYSKPYTGYYIHGYNTEVGRNATKLVPITKAEAEKLWQAEIDRNPDNDTVGYIVEDRQELYRLAENKRNLKSLEHAIKTVKPEDWDVKDDDQFKVNVDLLRKLSPSSWCTASSMTEHYVENYDNYLLIVDGVTVAGIEAQPDKKVKEVTSRANNRMAPIDHLDDIIAFFKKHNLDLNNDTINKAIKAKAAGKTDKDYTGYEDDEYYYADNYHEEEDRGHVDDPGREYRDDAIRDDIMFTVRTLDTEEEAVAYFNTNPAHLEFFHELPQNLKDTRSLAYLGVAYDSHNASRIRPTVPFYVDIVTQAVTSSPYIFNYLPEAGKDIPGLREIYVEYDRTRDDLPFSKTNTNQIQGYYDAKNDKVVVIASNTPVNEASKVAIHEVAHRGMLRMAKDLGGVKELGKALFAAEDQLMKKLPELLKRTGHKNLESLLEDYGFTTNSKEGKIKLLMELAARWAETLVDKPKPSWWKELLQSIKAWITKFTGVVLNDKEVDELVGGFVKYGTKQSTKTPSQNRDLFLHLSSELSSKLNFENPGYTNAPGVKDLINQMPMITKADIDQKKLEC